MSNKNNIGCLKAIMILCVAMFILIALFGALDGIQKALDNVPWYAYIIVLISFLGLITMFNKDE